MNNNNERPLGWTTLKESRQLIKASLSVKTADMHYWLAEGKEYVYAGKCFDPNGIPCWSLNALLELIPAEITYSDFKPFKLGIFKDDNVDKYHYFIQYYSLYEGGVFCETHGYTLVEASVNMILYLLNNKFIK